LPEPSLNAKDGTSQLGELAAAWRDAAEAGLRYYTKLGGLAVALTEALVPAIGELRPSLRLSRDTPSPAAGEMQAAVPSTERSEQTIVVEATAGGTGLGVFMVENTTAQAVSAPVGVSAFVDPSGREVRLDLKFSPDVVSLEPGDQVLVQVAAVVDQKLEPDVRYRGEVSIPRLSGARIPIVVRRRPGEEKAGGTKGAAESRKRTPRAAKPRAKSQRS
jgi:hypothetical protein